MGFLSVASVLCLQPDQSNIWREQTAIASFQSLFILGPVTTFHGISVCVGHTLILHTTNRQSEVSDKQ
jgi:hypothetical protein